MPATDTIPAPATSGPAGPANPGAQPAPPALVATAVRAHWTDRLAHVLLSLAEGGL
jgi:iron(III) transport system permease protein